MGTHLKRMPHSRLPELALPHEVTLSGDDIVSDHMAPTPDFAIGDDLIQTLKSSAPVILVTASPKAQIGLGTSVAFLSLTLGIQLHFSSLCVLSS